MSTENSKDLDLIESTMPLNTNLQVSDNRNNIGDSENVEKESKDADQSSTSELKLTLPVSEVSSCSSPAMVNVKAPSEVQVKLSDSVIVSSTVGEIYSLGVNSKDEESSITLGLCDTNQLKLGVMSIEKETDFTTEPSDLELINFSDVANLEHDLDIKPLKELTDSTNVVQSIPDNPNQTNSKVGVKITTEDNDLNIDSNSKLKSATPLESEVKVNLVKTENESDIVSTSNKMEKSKDTILDIPVAKSTQPLNALSLLAMHYDNDEPCASPSLSPALSVSNVETSPSSNNLVDNVTVNSDSNKPVISEPDSTTDLVEPSSDSVLAETNLKTVNPPISGLPTMDSKMYSVLNPYEAQPSVNAPSLANTSGPIIEPIPNLNHDPLNQPKDKIDASKLASETFEPAKVTPESPSSTSSTCFLPNPSSFVPLDSAKQTFSKTLLPISTEIKKPDSKLEVDGIEASSLQSVGSEILKSALEATQEKSVPVDVKSSDDDVASKNVIEPIPIKETEKNQISKHEIEMKPVEVAKPKTIPATILKIIPQIVNPQNTSSTSVPTIKIAPVISVIQSKAVATSVITIPPPKIVSKSLEEPSIPKPATESVTPTRIIIRPLPPQNPSDPQTTPKLNIKPILPKNEPLPRLIIKPISATRSVASIETVPQTRADAAPVSKSKPEVLSVPTIKILTKPGEPISIAKDPKRSHPDEETQVPSKKINLTDTQSLPRSKTEVVKKPMVDTAGVNAASLLKPAIISKIIKPTSTGTTSIATSLCDSDKVRHEEVPSAAVLPAVDPTPIIQKYLQQVESTPAEKSKPEPMDFQAVSFEVNETSLPVIHCENEDFSFVKPKSAELVDEVIDGGQTAGPFIEEETQSSWSLDTNKNPPSKMKEIIDPSIKIVDEESRASVGSVSSKKSIDDSVPAPPVVGFPASSVFEYQWPEEKGEFYILQEHLCEFLGVKSFKRKHPDLPRRNVDKDERVFLKEKNVVSETQCDLGLTALRSEDAMELMTKDYPEKYQEYVRAIQEKQRLALEKKAKEYANAVIDKAKLNDFLKKAIKSASEYNSHLNQERREERKMSFDLQTYTIHVPANKKRKLDPEATKNGKYPVALIPGQYQDYYRKFTTSELKYMPLNSVVYGPLQELNSINVPPGSDGSQSDSDGSDSEASCCSSSLGTQDGSGDSSSGSDSNVKNDVYFKPKEIQFPCKICHGNQEQNKQAQPEDLIHCSQCKTSAHPSCLELPAELVSVIKTYEWQCMDCKTCMLCMDPYDEEKMMFCDKCDRGFHTFCVGLKNLPSGRWICQLCGQCALCGSKTPGPEGTKLQWQQAAGEGNKKPQLLCVACSKKKAKT